MATFQIKEMRRNQFDKEDPLRDDAQYMYGVSRHEEKYTVTSATIFGQVKLLMKHFDVLTPSDLVGKTFDLPEEDDPSEALYRLLLNIQNAGKYTPPSAGQLLFRAINSLATMTCPDFSDVDHQTVYNFFSAAFKGFALDQVWFDEFKSLVTKHSAEEVQILNGNIEVFKLRVKGPAAYLKLVRGTKEIDFIFGPYSTPFVFNK